jgi:hypothetical protein
MNQTKALLKLAIVVSTFMTTNAFAHANFVENPADGSRNYKENARHFLRLNLAHTCGHGGTNYDIIHSGVLFPNGEDVVITSYAGITQTGNPDTTSAKKSLPNLNEVLQTYDANQKPVGANALMSIKPTLSSNWGKILLNKGAVPAFYNHGVNTTDVRSIYWMNAKSPYGEGAIGMSNDYAANLEFVTTLGKLQNCVAKVRVYTPAIDYCADGNAYLWGMNYTPMISETLVTASGGKLGVSVNYAPYIDIVRGANNPLDSKCATGEIVTVYPSANEIDNYLGKFAPAWVGKSTAAPQQCPTGQHLMNGQCMDNNAM